MNAARRNHRRTVASKAYGVRCPVCKKTNSRVIETGEGPGYVRRRRLCLTPSCLAAEHQAERGDPRRVVKGVRWTTYESIIPRRARTVPRGTNGTNGVSESGS